MIISIIMAAAIVAPAVLATRIKLSRLEPGACGRIIEVNESGAIGECLLEMGLTPGTEVELVRRGLFGDPIELRVRGYLLTLRRAQASRIVIAV